jgi:hypothetical protein
MDRITIGDLKRLLDLRGGIRVSFFMPTHRAGKETQQGPARLKNLLKRAEAELAAWIPRPAESQRLLQPIAELIGSKTFWRDQDAGLALFLSEQDWVCYRLPYAPEEQVVVSDRFYIKPLLPLLMEEGRFYLLTLSQKNVRLYAAGRDSLAPVPLPGVPASLKEALSHVDLQLQELYRPSASRGGGGTGAFYGHGTTSGELKDQVERFVQQVAKGVRILLADGRRPLLLAGVEPLLAMFRESCDYPYTMDAHLGGNPDSASLAELHRRAWAVMGPWFHRRIHESAALFEHRAGTGMASADVAEVLRAAAQGRVDRLFVAKDTDQWGRFDPDSSTVTLHAAREPGDEALLDRCAVETLLHQGEVYAVTAAELPKAARGAPLAAIYRY